MKANNAELCESVRFRRLAHVDLSKRLKKKKMKALVPQIVQIIYFGVLLMFCVGSLVISSGSFNCSSIVSFMTSLVLLIEPIQVTFSLKNSFICPSPLIFWLQFICFALFHCKMERKWL